MLEHGALAPRATGEVGGHAPPVHLAIDPDDVEHRHDAALESADGAEAGARREQRRRLLY